MRPPDNASGIIIGQPDTENPSYLPVLPRVDDGRCARSIAPMAGPVAALQGTARPKNAVRPTSEREVGREVGRQVVPILSMFVLSVLSVLPKLETSGKEREVQGSKAKVLNLDSRFLGANYKIGLLGRTGRTALQPVISMRLRTNKSNSDLSEVIGAVI